MNRRSFYHLLVKPVLAALVTRVGFGLFTVAHSLTILILASCSSGDNSERSAHAIPSGIPHVANREAVALAVAQPLKLIEELRLGLGHDEGSVPFEVIRAIRANAAGDIYVMDGRSQEIHVFDRDGNHLSTLGGPGEGPGEFFRALGMVVDPFGSLWVSDPGNRRYTVFGTDGRIRTHRRAARIGVGPWPARFTENGDFYDVSVERQWSREQRGPPSTVYAFEHVSAHGEVLDTVMLIRWPVRLDREGMNAIMDFAPRFVFAIDPTGAVWVANTKDYAVYRTLLPGGDTTLVFTLDSHAARVSEAERDSVVAQGWAESGDLPEYKPIIDRVFASSRYVFIIPMLEGYRPGSVIDVFTTDGVFVGRLKSPVTIDWRSTDFALGDHIYVGTLDELGVHQVSRLRIVQ